MNYKTLITAAALLAVPFGSAEPKAYDTIFYKGKAAGLKIAFEFGHSYRGGQQCQNHRICQRENNQVLFVG